MKSAQRKRTNANVAGLQPVAIAAQPASPGRSFEEVLRGCGPQISKMQRQIFLLRVSLLRVSLLRAFPWLNRAQAIAPEHLAAQPLASAWAWVKRNYVSSATKRLRVAETVSLGEKRFVAILRVDGCEFLIGGGTSGISLLAQVEKPLQSSAATESPVTQEVSR